MDKIFVYIVLLILVTIMLFFPLRDARRQIKDRKQNEKNRKSLLCRQASEILKNTPATLMLKAITPFVTLPKNTLFIFMANDKDLIIQSVTTPSINFSLNYSNLLMFLANDINELRNEKVSAYRVSVEREYLIRQLHLEYRGTDDNLIVCDFVYGSTIDDRWFNDAAKQGEDIFGYVNSRILKTNTTVKL